MKILHIITRLILGGAQENTVLSCLGQAEAGHDVTLAFGPIYGPEGSLLERVRESTVKTAELPDMIRDLHPLRDYRAYHQCRALIHELQPDVVHTHSSKAGILGRAAAWALDVPAVVHTIHGLPFHPYQSGWRNRLYIASERWAARRCHAIACVADAMSRQAMAAGVGRIDQFTTIYSGMEVESFLNGPDDRDQTRARLGLSEDDLVIGTVARLAELKGHDDLLDALAPLLEAHPRIRLLWVGDGWWRERLEKRIAEMGLKDRIVLTGLVPPESVPVMIRAMDVLIHPSYREGLPRTIPQALLSRVPVIAYDCDGAGEVCLDGETGLLVPPGDHARLAEAVRWMIEHPEQRTSMGERGRKLCAVRFDWREMVRQLDTLYGRILEQQRA